MRSMATPWRPERSPTTLPAKSSDFATYRSCDTPLTPTYELSLPLLTPTYEFDIAGRRWTIHAVRDQEALLAASETLETFPFGLMLWESAPVLAEALAERPQLVAGRRVLELGAGVGLAGLVARHLGAAQVRQTDTSEEALALCAMNAELNEIEGIDIARGDWTDWRDDALYDLIIGSDILYDRAAHAPVMAILARNLAPGGRVLLTDPGRMDTPAFIAALESEGWTVTRTVRMYPALAPVRNGDAVAITVIKVRM